MTTTILKLHLLCNIQLNSLLLIDKLASYTEYWCDPFLPSSPVSSVAPVSSPLGGLACCHFYCFRVNAFPELTVLLLSIPTRSIDVSSPPTFSSPSCSQLMSSSLLTLDRGLFLSKSNITKRKPSIKQTN